MEEFIIQGEVTKQEIKKELEQYFSINRTEEILPQTLWEAHKAYIRGIIIEIEVKRIRNKQVNDLLGKIRNLVSKHKYIGANKETPLKELTEQRLQLKELIIDKARKTKARNRKHFYEDGNKCSRLLALSLRQQRKNSYITCIKRSKGKTYDNEEIVQEIQRFFAKLYYLDTLKSQKDRYNKNKRSREIPNIGRITQNRTGQCGIFRKADI